MSAKVKRGETMIPWAKPEFSGNEQAYLVDALRSTWVSGGKYVDRFEVEFASACGSRFGVATSNGTTALHLALVALGIGPGDDVVLSTFSFVAPVNVVIHAGARPILVDCDPDTWCLDPGEIERAITPRTKAIIAVHVYGHPCDMEAIMRIASGHKLFVIEDAAEAHGSTCRSQRVGSIGTVGCFSFHAAKTLTMGEGGIVVTNDEALMVRMKTLRDHGMRKNLRYWHDEVGYNYRLTNLQAAVGCAQLERFDTIITRRREIAAQYCQGLASIPGVVCQREASWANCVLWAQAILIDPLTFGISRNALMMKLGEWGVETRPAFYPVHTMPIYGITGCFPVAEHVGANGLSLPTHTGLSEGEIAYIIDAIATIQQETFTQRASVADAVSGRERG